MPDKKALEAVIDIIPPKVKKIIDENVDAAEDIRAAVKGKRGEALVVTDRGVHVIKASGEHHFFDYGSIESVSIARVFRRGRFELGIRGMEKAAPPAAEGDFAADPAGNVVNFPFSKMAMFKKAEKMIRSVIEARSGG